MTKDTPPETVPLQLTGMTGEKKMEIKQQALRRSISVSALMLEAYDEYIKRHP